MGEEILGEGKSADIDDKSVLTGGEDGNKDDASKDDAGVKDASKDDASKDDAGVKDDAGKDADHDKDGNTDDKSKDGKADEGKDGAPEQYQDFSVPEGYEVDAELLSEFTPLLKELGASQEQGQKFVDLQAKVVQKVTDAQAKVWADTQGDWRKAGETDEEFGKGKYDESIMLARKAMRTIGGEGLVDALNKTGMGNHPEFIRFFYRVGKEIGEDNFSFGSANKDGAKTLAERMFPNQGKS